MNARGQSVESLLGVPPEEVGSPLGLAHSIEAGLTVAAVERLAQAVAPDDRDWTPPETRF